jgi:hypothetical protein
MGTGPMKLESVGIIFGVTEREKEVLIDVLKMTKEDIEDEPWWPDGNWQDDDERYIMQKHEACEGLLKKLEG